MKDAKSLLRCKLKKKKDFILSFLLLVFVHSLMMFFIFLNSFTNAFTLTKLIFVLTFICIYIIICTLCMKYYLKNANKEIELCKTLVQKSIKDKEDVIAKFSLSNDPVEVICVDQAALTKSQQKLVNKYGAKLFAKLNSNDSIKIILVEADGEEIVLKNIGFSSFLIYYKTVE